MRSRRITNGIRSTASVVGLALACSSSTTLQDPIGPEQGGSGSLELTVQVTGSAAALDGYDVSVFIATRAEPLRMSVESSQGALAFQDLPPGTLFFRVDGVSLPCRVVGNQPFAVEIDPAATARRNVLIDCPDPNSPPRPAPTPSGALELLVTGHDAPALRGYRALVQVEGEIDPRVWFSSGARTTIPSLPPGTHSVRVEPLAENCRAGNSSGDPVTIVAGETAAIELVASCSPVFGSLAGSYELTVPIGATPAFALHFILAADGSFRLRYSNATRSFEYRGIFYRQPEPAGTGLNLLFADYPGLGLASANVAAGCLEVEFNDFMLLTDFTNGRYCR